MVRIGSGLPFARKAILPSMIPMSAFAVPTICQADRRRAQLASLAFLRAAGRVTGDKGIDHASDGTANNWRDPEEPELL